MRANDVRSSDPIRHGAYVCLSGARAALARAPVPALAQRLGLRNEFDAGDGHPDRAIGFLRRVDATPADIDDDVLLRADAVVHVASPSAEDVDAFTAELARLVDVRVLRGVLRPTRYTGNEMHNFSYARQLLQQPGTAGPTGFLLPMSKTAAWWEKDWMERHTYFLPRYDDSGRMVRQGHALAAAPGIDCLMRRTYKHAAEPAPAGAYDFVNYFECADADVPRFHEVCAALRDVARNPGWQFVREGPLWQGRRVASWGELFE